MLDPEPFIRWERLDGQVIYQFGENVFALPDFHGVEDVMKVSIFDDLQITLREIFAA